MILTVFPQLAFGQTADQKARELDRLNSVNESYNTQVEALENEYAKAMKGFLLEGKSYPKDIFKKFMDLDQKRIEERNQAWTKISEDRARIQAEHDEKKGRGRDAAASGSAGANRAPSSGSIVNSPKYEPAALPGLDGSNIPRELNFPAKKK